ncbi:hypothetical protein BCT33_20840 [Vibrio lentus]|nr:hypothetical protein BCU14_09380 [Vibrio lentus]PMN39636.1 hypothetical protein BCT33_20840 [Vibrio lentus]PMN62581.1 hypothetical protein BCT29_15395 [Vibrio lentus]
MKHNCLLSTPTQFQNLISQLKLKVDVGELHYVGMFLILNKSRNKWTQKPDRKIDITATEKYSTNIFHTLDSMINKRLSLTTACLFIIFQESK